MNNRRLMEDRRLRHSHVFVTCAVVEQVAFAALHHALDEYNVGHLAYLFPFLFRLEDGPVASPDELARILTVEDGDPRAVDELVVRAVIHQDDPFGRNDRRWPGLRHA